MNARGPFLVWMMILVAGGVLSTHVEVHAQSPAASDKPAAGPSADDLRAQLKSVEDNTGLDEAVKTRLVELYTQAIQDVARADEWSAKAQAFDQARLEAPATLKQLSEELAAPAKEAKPDVPADASLALLEQKLAGVEADLKAARDGAVSLDEERKRRATRRTELPAATTAARKSLEEVARSIGALAEDTDVPEMVTARGVALRSRQRALEGEIRSYEAELASYDARGDLLTARRDSTARKVTYLEALASAWQTVVVDRRRTEAAAAAQAADQARRAAARAHPVVRRLADENTVWTQRRQSDGLADKIAKATSEREALEKATQDLAGRFDSIQQRVGAAGLTHAMGLLLRRQKETLPELQDHRKQIKDRDTEISRVEVELIELDDAIKDLRDDMESMVQTAVSEVDDSVAPQERQEIERTARELLQARRDYINALRGDYDAYLTKLAELGNAERSFVAMVAQFRAYIAERVLWVRSTSPPRLSDLQDAMEALAWLTNPDNWVTALSAAGLHARAQAPLVALAVVLIALPGVYRRRLRRAVTKIGESAARPTARSFVPTVMALLWSLLVALFWPALLGLLGWIMAYGTDTTGFGKTIGTALSATAVWILLVELYRQILSAGGLGDAHFGWPTGSVQRARRHLVWLMTAGVPIVFLVVAAETTGEVAWQNALGRLGFVAGQTLLAIFFAIVLRPHGAVLGAFVKLNPTGWIGRLRHVWYPLAVGIPLTLATLAVVGYHYTALELAMGVFTTLWLILVLILLNGLALRWLLVSRRELAMEQARQRRAAASTESHEGGPESVEPVIDLGSIDVQTKSILRTVIVLGFFGGIWVVWSGMLPALGYLDQTELWSVWGKVTETVTSPEGQSTTRLVEKLIPVTLQDCLLAALILAITLVAGRNAPGLLEIALLKRLPLKAGERYAVATVAKYAITVVGVVVGFKMIGIGWSEVQWLAAAMVVGLGFGLQEIFANFVSGLILLFERPIRIGDTVTVGNVSGEVTRIQIRATTITDWDRKELVIPNKEFVTGQVINWTLSDSILRVIIPVGIAYGSDTARAEEILHEVAREDNLVLDEPKPQVLFVSFGDSSLGFELRVHISSVEYFVKARHQLHKAIDAAFRKAGIEIAFPQRDIHIRSIRDALPIDQASPTKQV